MPLLKTLVRGMSGPPGYTLMRGAARFQTARAAVAAGRGTLHAARLNRLLRDCQANIKQTVFRDMGQKAFVKNLNNEGAAFGLCLPPDMVEAIVRYAHQTPCHADREAGQGFMLARRDQAEQHLGKPILVAQYFNAAQDCPAIAQLASDPLLRWIAGRYLGSVPTLVGVNLWWTFPVDASDEDRDRHAHLFHRDVDDFRFFKFFFDQPMSSPWPWRPRLRPRIASAAAGAQFCGSVGDSPVQRCGGAGRVSDPGHPRDLRPGRRRFRGKHLVHPQGENPGSRAAPAPSDPVCPVRLWDHARSPGRGCPGAHCLNWRPMKPH